MKLKETTGIIILSAPFVSVKLQRRASLQKQKMQRKKFAGIKKQIVLQNSKCK